MNLPPVDRSRLEKIAGSEGVRSALSAEEIKSLIDNKEHMGVLCVDEMGNVKDNIIIESIGDDDSAFSLNSINEIGKKCGDDHSVWWHTHSSSLSAMSPEDRLSAGNLKLILGNDITCAAGIEGYSCHLMNSSPPKPISRGWDNVFFDSLKESPIIEKIFDSNEKWMLVAGKESDVHHLSCGSDDGVAVCTGVDWKTGFNNFPVGAFNQMVFSGNVDITPAKNGFMLLASKTGGKLDCITINVGREKLVLYCG